MNTLLAQIPESIWRFSAIEVVLACILTACITFTVTEWIVRRRTHRHAYEEGCRDTVARINARLRDPMKRLIHETDEDGNPAFANAAMRKRMAERIFPAQTRNTEARV